MRSQNVSRRNLIRGFGGLAAAALSGSIVPGKVARAGEGDVELPREGSYIDGRKVVYIDGSEKYRTLDTPNTYNVLVEPVERESKSGFYIRAPRISLRNDYALTGKTGVGVDAIGDDIHVIGGNIAGFEIGGKIVGNGNIVSGVVANKNWYQGLIIEGDSNLVREYAAKQNFDAGLLITGKRNVVSDSILEENLDDIVIDGKAVQTVARNTFYGTESVRGNGELLRIWTFNGNVNDSNSLPVLRARLSLIDSSGATEFSVPTDETGSIKTMDVPAYFNVGGLKDCIGSYKVYMVQVEKEGFKPQVREIEAKEPITEQFNLESA